jgi:hypothetical protein
VQNLADSAGVAGRVHSFDLEPLIPRLEAEKNVELLKLITFYGHGLCHEMADYLSLHYGLKIGELIDKDSGDSIHAFVMVGDGLGLDAYGVNPISVVQERYARITGEHLETRFSERATNVELPSFVINDVERFLRLCDISLCPINEETGYLASA